MNAATTLAASVQAKKGRLYAVIQVRENGKTKPVWRALGLPESANKSKVNKAYREVGKPLNKPTPSRSRKTKSLPRIFRSTIICAPTIKRSRKTFKRVPPKATAE